MNEKIKDDTEPEVTKTFYNGTGKEIRIFDLDSVVNGPMSYEMDIDVKPLLIIPPDDTILKATEYHVKARYLGSRDRKYKIVANDYDLLPIFDIEGHDVLYYKDVSFLGSDSIFLEDYEWIIVGNKYFEAVQRRVDRSPFEVSRKYIRPCMEVTYQTQDGSRNGDMAGYCGFEYLEDSGARV